MDSETPASTEDAERVAELSALLRCCKDHGQSAKLATELGGEVGPFDYERGRYYLQLSVDFEEQRRNADLVELAEGVGTDREEYRDFFRTRNAAIQERYRGLIAHQVHHGELADARHAVEAMCDERRLARDEQVARVDFVREVLEKVADAADDALTERYAAVAEWLNEETDRLELAQPRPHWLARLPFRIHHG